MNLRLTFYFINFSPFHGNGDVIWLGEKGHVVIQRAAAYHNKVFIFEAMPSELKEVRSLLAKADPKSLQVIERDAIPGEVKIKFGFRDRNENWVSLKIIDNDWSRQPKDIQNFDIIAQRLIGLTLKREPIRVEKFKPGQLHLEQPREFLAADLRRAID